MNVVAVSVAWPIHHEPVTGWQAMGGLVVLASVAAVISRPSAAVAVPSSGAAAPRSVAPPPRPVSTATAPPVLDRLPTAAPELR
jgi:hypothetical protein